MVRSITNAGYGLVPQRFAGRNDNEAIPSNTHITDTQHDYTHAPQRFEEYNVYEALFKPPHHYCMSLAEKIFSCYGFAPQRFPGRNDNKTGPINRHITNTEHGYDFPTQRLEGCNDNEAGQSNTHVSTIQHDMLHTFP
ncbi:hypothetical protein DEO72_LG3g560 [Vigna unguiculata]|uniref:Uncharacterized protein n=1 Tax=Vigna unguiculata TaxID=3917 RepID=A0A4D6LBW5_VIGUN|nr:hypothetical protein DEO72_LG3g560 [Vigna unguiculata]